MALFLVSRCISSSFMRPHLSKLSRISFASTSTSPADNYWVHLQKNSSTLENTLNTVRDKLDSKCVSQILQKCVNEPLLGLRFFIWSSFHQSNYRHGSFVYREACKLFKIEENPRIVIDLLEDLRFKGCSVSAKQFKVVLNLCREAKIANESLLVLKKMKEFNCNPDTTSYNVVVKLLCQKGDLDQADSLLEEMDSFDLHPNMITYTSIIKGFCDADRIDDAFRVFQAMKNHGCSPNIVLYSTLLDGICRFGSLTKTLEVLGEMERVGGFLNPNTVTYTSVIQTFCEKNRLTEALTIFDRMEGCGCIPNRVTVSTLLNSFCREEKVEEAYKFTDRVVVRAYVSNSEGFSSLVVALLRYGKSIEAEKLIRKMIKCSIKPDGLSSSMIFRGICLEGRIIDGYLLYYDMYESGNLSTIDSDIHSIILAGLCENKYLSEALYLARIMTEREIRVKSPYVNTIFEYLKDSGETHLLSHISGTKKLGAK